MPDVDLYQVSASDPVERYLSDDGEWKAGVRPPNVIETVDDLAWLAEHNEATKTEVVCRWCGTKAWPRNLNEGSRWWQGHECVEGEEIAA